MSKSLGNAIGIEEPPGEIYGKTMSIPDALMWDWYLLLTDLPQAEIEERKRRIEAGEVHPKQAKQELARYLVGVFLSAARRLVRQGAVAVDDDKVSDPFTELAPRAEPYLLKVGKRRFARVRVR